MIGLKQQLHESGVGGATSVGSTTTGPELPSPTDAGENVSHRASAPQPDHTTQYKIQLEDYVYNKYKSCEKHGIAERFKLMMSIKSKTSFQAVRVTSQRGSLIVSGEAEEVDTTQWPTEGQVREVVSEVHRQQGRTQV